MLKFLILWGLQNFLPMLCHMSMVCRSYFSMINLYSIGVDALDNGIIYNIYIICYTVVKSVNVEMIRHRRNSDTESNDNTSRSVIFEKYYHLTLPNPQR